MATWTAPALLDELKTKLTARAGLSGVTVATGPLGDETPPEAIVFFGVDGSQDWASIGGKTRDDDYRVDAAIWIVKPGAGETEIKAARDRAAAILKEIEDEFRADPTVNGKVTWCHVVRVVLEQGSNVSGRWCQISFDLGVRARI